VTAKIVGYKRAALALDRSRYATTSPRVIALPDGTFVGVGDQHTDGDAMLFGARGTSAWRSEVSLSVYRGHAEADHINATAAR